MKNFQGRLVPARRKAKYIVEGPYEAVGIVKNIVMSYETNTRK